MFRFGPISATALRQAARAAEQTSVTYDFVGATLKGQQPAQYHHDCYEMTLSARRDAFELGVAGIQAWVPHLRAGLRVEPHDPPAESATVAVAARVGGLTTVAPCRIVAVVDEPDRYGFAYGTLPGHPERGEEAFLVERRGDSTVFRLVAYSRPAALLARLGGPVTRRVQVSASHRYLQGLVSYVDEAPTRP